VTSSATSLAGWAIGRTRSTVAPGGSVAFPANTNQPLWFTVHVPVMRSRHLSGTVSVGTATVPSSWRSGIRPAFVHPLAANGASAGATWWSATRHHQRQRAALLLDLVDALYEDFADHRLTPKGVGWPALNYPAGWNTTVTAPSARCLGDWDFATLARSI